MRRGPDQAILIAFGPDLPDQMPGGDAAGIKTLLNPLPRSGPPLAETRPEGFPQVAPRFTSILHALTGLASALFGLGPLPVLGLVVPLVWWACPPIVPLAESEAGP